MENKIFEITSKKGLGPGFIESDGSSFRVEKFFHGKGFTSKQLTEQETIEKTMKLICDFNYDEDLFNLVP